MVQDVDFDIRQMVVFGGSFGPREIRRLIDVIGEEPSLYGVLRDAVAELQKQEELSPAGRVRLGVCYYLMGRYYRAIEALQKSDGGALAHFYLGKAHFARGEYPEALNSYAAARKAGYDLGECGVAEAEVQRHAGEPETALATLDNLSGAIEQTAEYLTQRAATVASLGGNQGEVVALYERAVEIDQNHQAALFGLALENDRHGNDRESLALYERAVARFPVHVGSLLNLGLAYEDAEQFERAARCYRRILDVFPDHPRAALFIKDTEASSDQYYDEDAQRKRDRLSQVLNVPVTDFELSVRSRNCLQKMGIMTLGDLGRCTEAELLASKNFGETSLVEIKDMLASKGLQLGQFATQRQSTEIFEPESLSADEQALLNNPISALNLSVRARKCMIRLGINTISDLIRRTGDELLECKNFGVTSLNEVREKLAAQGLKLRGE